MAENACTHTGTSPIKRTERRELHFTCNRIERRARGRAREGERKRETSEYRITFSRAFRNLEKMGTAELCWLSTVLPQNPQHHRPNVDSKAFNNLPLSHSFPPSKISSSAPFGNARARHRRSYPVYCQTAGTLSKNSSDADSTADAGLLRLSKVIFPVLLFAQDAFICYYCCN